jgi:hypothetical protein
VRFSFFQLGLRRLLVRVGLRLHLRELLRQPVDLVREAVELG